MDGRSFDDLTRSLASGISRRRTLKTLLAGVAGAALGAAGLEETRAGFVCRKYFEICRKPGECCGNHCGPKDATGRRRCGSCPSGSSPCGAEGCCAEGQTCVNDTCCDNPCGLEGPELCCGDGETCIIHFGDDQGYTFSCCAESLACNDNQICCAANEECLTGSVCCHPDDICNGEECCGEDALCTEDSGCCESTLTCTAPGGALFCCGEGGECDDNGCINSESCEFGSCQSAEEDCPGEGNWDCCGGCCVNLDFDNANCGECGVPCEEGSCCFLGECDPSNCIS